LLVAVISSSALSTADSAAPPLLSGPSSASAANAESGLGTGADSFQNILAQAVTPGESSQSGPALSAQAQSIVTPQLTLSAIAKTNVVITSPSTAGVAHQPLAAAALPSAADLLSQPDSAASVQTATGLAAKPTASLAKLPLEALGRAASAKGAPRGSARQAQSTSSETATSGINTDSLASNQTPVMDATAANTSAASQHASLALPAEQNNQAFAGPIAALGGLKPLAGAAFLLHLKTDGSQGDSAQSANTDSNAASNAASSLNDTPGQTAAPQAEKTDVSSASALTLPTGGPGSFVAEAAPQTSSAPPLGLSNSASRAESASAPLSASAVDDSSATAAQPVRTVVVQLAGTDDRRVDLRLVEHAGGLSVSVRASDGALTSSLQEHLPELSARLASEHYETQVLMPFASQTSHGGFAGSSGQQQSSSQSPDQGGGRSFSQGGSSSGGDGNQRQGRQPEQQQEWKNPFTASAPSPPAISFESELSDSTTNY
jgi:hypothetical protein